ncbi:MAG: N-acetylmuramoyl-L-alanine amidase [Clostridia bacterium]|nr:N-acetylmuramoyl-L-alanine amidase [Clostridia bacterium]
MLKKKTMIAALVVVLTAVCVLSGVLISGRYQKPQSEAEETTEAQVDAVALPLASGKKATVPKAVRGTKAFISEESFKKSSPDAVMQKIAQCGFNAVLFQRERSNTAFPPNEGVSALKEYVAAARKTGLYTAVSVSGEAAQPIADFAASSGADCLVLSDTFASSGSMDYDALSKKISELETAVRPSQVSLLLWQLPYNARRSAENAGFLAAFSKAIGESGCTGVYTYSDAANDSFVNDADGWITYCADKPLWFSLTDTFAPKEKGFLHMENALRQTSMLLPLGTDDSPVSFIFGAYADFADDAECCKIVKSSMTDGVIPESYLKTFKITNYNSTTISTTESKINFIGECNPTYTLQCNGAVIPVSDEGYFSCEYTLKVGSNTFNFTCNGKSYPYTVQYTLDLIRSITPSGNLNSPGGSTVDIYVVAHRGASVYATLGGARIPLTATGALTSGADGGHIDMNSDYVTFTGKYTLPASQSSTVSVGTIQAFASYQGMSDSITGARVSVTAQQKVEALPVVDTTPQPTQVTTTTTTTTKAAPTTSETTADPDATDDLDLSESGSESEGKSTTGASSTTSTTTTSATQSTTQTNLGPVITPYSYQGLPGTKRMCKVTTYYTETMPLSPLNDLSDPLSTPLLIGTFDFITGESSFDTHTYYNLGSGKRVYRKDVEVIEKAYAMPANTLTVVNSGTYSGKTSINLHTKWKVPFNVILNGQKYINDAHNNREFAVSSLNARSLDLTFCYTAKAVGTPNVSSSGIISGCEWVQSDSQTCTLRLYLRSASRFYGYSVSYNSDDTLNISVKEKGGDSISGKTIMLDPGHGGPDPGATCAVNSGTYCESKIALAIAEKTRSKLQSMGASVIMTRTSEIDLTMDSRKRMARQSFPDAFVAIHLDAAGSSSAAGTTAFYYRPYSYALAKSIHSQLVSAYNQSIYGAYRSTTDRGTIFFPFSVTRIEECPSVLIECGFVSNLEECRILQTPKHQETIAQAIANGIRDFFANN